VPRRQPSKWLACLHHRRGDAHASLALKIVLGGGTDSHLLAVGGQAPIADAAHRMKRD
jgi:hypothetical protein